MQFLYVGGRKDAVTGNDFAPRMLAVVAAAIVVIVGGAAVSHILVRKQYR